MSIEPTTALNLAILHYKAATVLTLPDCARSLAAAAQAYLAAEAAGQVLARDRRRYTSQMAHAALAVGQQATRPHEREAALGPFEEIETAAKAELAAERDALKKMAATAPVEAQALDENRYDVKLGLVG